MNYVKIGDVCSIHARIGWQGLTKKEYLMDGDYYLVTGVDFLDGNVDFRHCYFVSKDRYEQDVHIQVEKDDVLITKDGTIGKVAYVAEKPQKPATLNSGVFVVRPQSTKQLLPRYLKYALESNHFSRFIESIKVGCTIPHLNQEKFLNYRIALPSLVEQKNIIEQLDIVYSLLSKKKSQIFMMDELVKSRFVEMFGTIDDNRFDYMECSLQDVCEPIKDGTHQTPEYTDDTAEGYKFLSSKDVTSGVIDWAHLKYIPEYLHRELYARIAPRKGDILLAKNGTTGVAAIVDRDEVFDIYVSLALIRPLSVDTTYLWAAINSTETKRQFDRSLKGIGVPNLHLGEIKKVRILHPPKDKQNRFAAFVAEVDKSKLSYEMEVAA